MSWLSGVAGALAVLWLGWLLRPSSARQRVAGLASTRKLGDPRALAASARRRGSRRVAERRANELGELVEVASVGVVAGLSLQESLRVATASVSNDAADQLRALLADDQLTIGEALDRFAQHVGAVAFTFVEVVSSSLRYGIEASGGLERLAAELRAETQRRVEARLRRLPVALLFPLVLCVMPALGLLSVVPVVAAAFQLV